MTADWKTAPFRADHVGSLLRSPELHKARKDFQDNSITSDALRKVENREIERIVDKQIETGLKAVTDGEFRRRFWHTDFLEHLNGIEGYVPEQGYQFKGMETERYDIRSTGKISFNPEHPFLQDFKEFKNIVGDRAVAKQTIPSPNQLFNEGIQNPDFYPDLEEYAADIIRTYQDAIKAFYESGCRYLQLDDVYIAGLCAPKLPFSSSELSRQELIELALRVVNGSLEGKPEDMTVTTHLCRGNYRSAWAFEGAYDTIAPTLFAKEKVDGFFLEYDDERSGTFKPLEQIPQDGTRAVIGVFTSKSGELEDKEEIKARVEEASTYIPKHQLCISPQCGFASTHHGNELTEEDQWRKLKYIVETAEEIWGDE